MPIRSEPLRPALTRCPGPMIAASISPAISAATAKGLRGIKMNCMSRPCFLNNPRSRATHTAVMLSLVTLDDKFDLTWAFKNCGPQRVANSRLARNRQGYAWKGLRIVTEPIDGSSANTLASTVGAVSTAPKAAVPNEQKSFACEKTQLLGFSPKGTATEKPCSEISK